MKKKILFILIGLILISGVFYGGFYLGQKKAELPDEFIPVDKSELESLQWVGTDYGVIKDIDSTSVTFYLYRNGVVDFQETIKVWMTRETEFYTDEERVNFADFQIDDIVTFAANLNNDASVSLLWMRYDSESPLVKN